MPLDLLSPEFRRDPYPALASAREAEPVHQDALGIWYVLRHADCVSLMKDPRLGRDLRKWAGYGFVRPYIAESPLERCVESWMFSLDPPEHTRLRRLVARAFTPKAVEAMRGFIERTADELIDEMGDAREVDLMRDFAQPFPVRVIARILGLSIDDYAELRRWSDAVAVVVEPTARKKQRLAANDALVELTAYLAAQAAERRRAMGDDVLSTLLRAEDDGDRLGSDELISQLVLLFIAGHETTANLIGNGMLALLRHPAELARLRADASLVPTAVDEMLRFDGPVNTNARAVHVDVEVAGKVIPKGSLLMCMLGSANRDPSVFASPDRFDVGRSPNPHIGFGGGVHFCLGAPLARLEAQVAFECLLARFPQIETDEARIEWRDLVNLRGLKTFPVRLSPRADR